MVVRVSKPNFFDTSWLEIVIIWLVIVSKWWDIGHVSATTDLFHLLTCDWFTVAVHRSLCHNDDVQTGATASLLSGKKKPLRSLNRLLFTIYNMYEKIITSDSLLHRCSSQCSSGGISGMKTQSAPQARAVTKARYLIVKSRSWGLIVS